MGLFRHPHLIRGIVHTAEGAFQIERGLVDVPDEVGLSLGWIRVDDEAQPLIAPPQTESDGRSPSGPQARAL
jgi:hypothetical protein